MSSPISFTGLVSGLDSKSIISAMLQVAQAPVKLMQAQQQTEQSKLSAYQDLNTKLQALQTAASTLNLPSTTGAKKVGFSGPSGEFATANALSSATNGSFQLQIDTLATATSVNSTAHVGGAVVPADVATSSSKTQIAITAGTFTVDGHAVAITAGDSFQNIFNNINTATGGDVTASFDANNHLVLTSGSATPITLGNQSDTSNFLSATRLAGQPIAATVTGSTPVGVANANAILDNANIAGLTSTTNGTIVINGTTITYNTAVDTLNTVINRINSSAAGVMASYDPNSDTISIQAQNTGNVDITLGDGGGNLLSSLNVTAAGAHTIGSSAKYEVNGTTFFSLSNAVNNVVPGVNVTFEATTPSALTVSVSQDPSIGVGAIQSFVSAYNSVIDQITKLTAYDPNTKTAGLFLGDSVIENLNSQLNNGLFTSNGQALGLTPGFQSVTDIGLSTGPIGSTPGTTTDVTFDATKFQNALNTNPTAVTNLVTSVFGNLSTQLMQITSPGGEMDNAVQSENGLIKDLQDQINNQNDLIAQQQDFLTQEFSQLEAQLAQIQSQAAIGASALSSFASQSAQSSGSGLTSQLLGNGQSSGAASGSSGSSGA